MYTRIVVPLDGSATAEAVLPYVEALAAGFRTAIELVSVIDLGGTAAHFSDEKVHHLDTLLARMEKSAATYLEDVARRLNRFSPDCRILRGQPAEAILESANKEHNILLALATHGR